MTPKELQQLIGITECPDCKAQLNEYCYYNLGNGQRYHYRGDAHSTRIASYHWEMRFIRHYKEAEHYWRRGRRLP